MYWRYIGDILEMYWRCIGDVLEMYWRCIRDMMDKKMGSFIELSLLFEGCQNHPRNQLIRKEKSIPNWNA